VQPGIDYATRGSSLSCEAAIDVALTLDYQELGRRPNGRLLSVGRRKRRKTAEARCERKSVPRSLSDRLGNLAHQHLSLYLSDRSAKAVPLEQRLTEHQHHCPIQAAGKLIDLAQSLLESERSIKSVGGSGGPD
jgi:hypothetical protein